MRISSYKLAVLMSYILSLSLVILTLNILVDVVDKVTEITYTNETFADSVISSDSVQKRDLATHYSPLPLTNNLWTLYDIRRGARMEAPQNIGVITDTDLIVPDQNIKASSDNRTVQANVLIYNRVPKCGSTFMQGIIRNLRKKNSFLYESSSIYWR